MVPTILARGQTLYLLPDGERLPEPPLTDRLG